MWCPCCKLAKNPVHVCACIQGGSISIDKIPIPADSVNAPKHYTSHNVQAPGKTINVIEAWDLPYHLGNVLKYIARFRDKNGIEDLKKARWYLDRYITGEEKKDNKNPII